MNAGGAPGLEISGLSHSYGARKALDGVGFTVGAGEFCALLGPNGAGKSTLFALLTRLFVARTGTIRICGVDLAQEPRKALARIGVVFQQPTLDLDLSVARNMAYYAALHGMPAKAAALEAARALERLGMAERANEKVRALNGGHRRRMEIARALIHRPSVLLLDEPTVGLDAPSRRAITQHVHSLAREDGLTVLWATHLVDEVTPDDRLVILHQGRIAADGVCREIAGAGDLGAAFARIVGAPA